MPTIGDYEVVIEQVDEATILDVARNPVPGRIVWFSWGGDTRAHVEMPKVTATKALRDKLILREIAEYEEMFG